jgi:hypothetical protein
MVVVDSQTIDFAPQLLASVISSIPVNISGGVSTCGAIGGAGLVYFPWQSAVGCISIAQSPYGMTRTLWLSVRRLRLCVLSHVVHCCHTHAHDGVVCMC